ncbi:MAG: PhoX family phosphatase [Betaproteobacteria bacterium]|nr:PhoX family phosphatase [Betaproteobacteria bacterium]NBO88404.1 PhoX family phosphatase [Betaproteobacteria bacterium]NDF64828.1 PhoX family phosphatase [Betaproteobacteria bacterium]
MAHHSCTNTNTSSNETFDQVLKRGLKDPSRRLLIKGGVGLASVVTLPMLNACADSESTPSALKNLPSSSLLGFSPTAKSLLDSVVVPAGYTVSVLHATGDRLRSSETAYSNTGSETDDWSQRVGDHHDGMHLFYIAANGKVSATATSKAVIAVNHESSADAHFLHATGQTSAGITGKKFDQFGTWDLGVRPGAQALKEINLHGVSIAEVTLNGSGQPTGVVLDSALNRRITPETVMSVAGPAAHLNDIRDLFKTKFDTTGATSRGTLNNCGYGYTPWGTYLTCEENWATYFALPTSGVAANSKLTASRSRYGVASSPLAATATKSSSQGWYTVVDLPDTNSRFSRWNISASGASVTDDFRQEPHTFGYCVEIDPADSTSTPVKRTAMGRFAHEAAVCSLPEVGKPLSFYMGCDSRNEYIYKFVTTANWDAADYGGGLLVGNKYLNEGKLYVAKFNSDGTGQWIELTYSDSRISSYNKNGFTFAHQADVLVHTRLAADAVGATKMDRPEWGAVNPANGEIYFALTNNTSANRTPLTADAANPRSYADADGKKSSGNPNGHIIRFRETGSLSTATTFSWDIFLFGAEEDMSPNVNISALTANNSFSSPDGLWFSKASGICWIQTDDGAYTDETNCMLLAAVPGQVGDGGAYTFENTLGSDSAYITTFVGGLLGATRLKRFLVAPKGSEVTGLTETADGKALLVNIQHPGENTAALGSAATFTFESQWPGNGGGLSAGYGVAGRPRSATLVITRADGKRIGEA